MTQPSDGVTAARENDELRRRVRSISHAVCLLVVAERAMKLIEFAMLKRTRAAEPASADIGCVVH